MDDKKPAHPLLQFFKWEHLPEHLQTPSKWFSALAHQVNDLPDNAEKTTALRKLLEAKDCAVRALLFKDLNPLVNPDVGVR